MKKGPSVSSFLSDSTNTHWGQVFISPSAYGSVEIKDGNGNAQEKGIAVLTRLTRVLSHPPESLRDAEIIAHDVLDTTVLSIVLLVPFQDIVYAVVIGGGVIYLKRGVQFSCLLQKTGSISGTMSEGDTYILCNESGKQAIDFRAVPPEIVNSGTHTISEYITLQIRAKKNITASAGVVYQPVGLQEDELLIQKVIKEAKNKENKKDDDTKDVSTEHKGTKWFQLVAKKMPMYKSLRSVLTSKQTLTVVLVLFFLISVGLGIYKQRTNVSKKQLTEVTNKAQELYEEGVALLELNTLKGRQRLEDAEELLRPYTSSVSERSAEGRALYDLYKEVAAYVLVAKKNFEVEPELYYTLGLKTPDGYIAAASMYENTLSILDKTSGGTFLLDVESKNITSIIGKNTFEDPQLIASGPYNQYVLDAEGIYEVDAENGEETLVIKQEESWGEIASLVTFAGNLYLLDKTHSRIWKYIATDTGFSAMKEYLNPDTLPDLSNSINMVIDGSVWLGMDDGDVLRFTSGREDSFSFEGIEPEMGEKLFVYTFDAIEYIYVLDNDNTRIVKTDKDGVYVSQYVWKEDIVIDAFFVDQYEKRALLLSKGELYTFLLEQ